MPIKMNPLRRKIPVCNWERVRYWRSRLIYTENLNEYPVLDSLEKSWQTLCNHYEYVPRDEYDRLADDPFSAFIRFIDKGIYPPPEILLTLLDAYYEYIKNPDVSLEKAFFGHPVPKAGNYASRQRLEMRNMLLRNKFQELISAGKKRVEAAEIVSGKIMEGELDADTILRMFRKVKPHKKAD